MKIKSICQILILATLVFFSCEEDKKGPLVESSDIPTQISNVKVENRPGSARISYTLPEDPSIVYVEASYIRAGKKSVMISSAYQNSIMIEGLSKTSEQIVELTTINKYNNRSQPVEASIHPLTPPIDNVFNSMVYGSTFGGLYYRFENLAQQEYLINTIVKDSLDEWVEYDRFYSTSVAEIENTVRGLDSIPMLFGIYVEDSWLNTSDTVIFELTPLYEQKFDKSLWSQYNLLDDSNKPRYGPLENIWHDKEDLLDNSAYFFMDPNIPGLALPNWFTIDLGAEYKFGRMKVHNVHHGAFWRYSLGTPRTFEIWGTNNPSVNWNDWTLLGSFECVKPSGAPLGVVEDKDLAQLIAGDDYDFPPQADDAFYKYIRFKTNTTFGNLPDVFLLELTLWGQKKKKN